jgi:hypothetical protein
MKNRVWFAALLVAVVGAVACSVERDPDTEAAAGKSAAANGLNPADFSPTITHPLFPLTSVRNTEFAGRKQKDGATVETRVVSRLLDKTDTLAGVTVAVVEVKDYENGALVELTEDYFAQHRDGGLWYFGERVTDYKDGQPIGHEGQWLAGENDNRPGLFLPADPTVGQEFSPESVAGVADERSTVRELGVEVTVPAGKFTGCVKIEDLDLLDNDRALKVYCPGKGLVREEGSSGSTDLVRLA